MYAPNEQHHDASQKPQRERDPNHRQPTPWVSAEECQPPQRPIAALDEVDEALLESFPCSDPPCYTHAHA